MINTLDNASTGYRHIFYVILTMLGGGCGDTSGETRFDGFCGFDSFFVTTPEEDEEFGSQSPLISREELQSERRAAVSFIPVLPGSLPSVMAFILSSSSSYLDGE